MRNRRLAVSLLLVVGLLMVSSLLTAQEATSEATAQVTPTTTAATTAQPTTPATATTTPATATTPAPTATSSGTTHTVRAGETLFRIARQYGVSVNALASANGLTNLNLIFAGQRLVIPATTGTATPTVTAPATTPAPGTPTATTPAPTATATTPPGATTYVVQRGETLFRIALRFRTTVAELQRANNLANPNLIFTGQRLTIPAAGSGATTQAQTTAPTAPETGTLFAAQAIADNGFGRGIEVFIEGQDVNALTTQAVLVGVEWVKITANWREIEATEGSPDFADLDRAVDAFNRAGLNIMLTLTGAPEWSRPNESDVAKASGEFGPPNDVADFGTFAGAVAERYAGKVQAYEIWSEPNLRRAWLDPVVNIVTTTNAAGQQVQLPDARMSNIRYFDLFKAGRDAIKAADADAQVITGGLAPTGFNDRLNAIDDQVFLAALADQGILPLADGIGVQPDGFANPPDAACCEQTPGVSTHFDNARFYFINTLSAYRQILNQKNGQNAVLWVTRFGWGTAEGNNIKQPTDTEATFMRYTSPAEQATYIPRAFEIGQELGYIGPMFLYNLNGCQANNGEACYYSLVDSTRAARPVFVALQNVAQPTPAAPAAEATAEATAESSGG